MIARRTIESPLGLLTLSANHDALLSVSWRDESTRAVEAANHPILAHAAGELERYFAGEPIQFSVPWQLEGSAFQQTVWQTLAALPYGTTTHYGELANAVGKPGGARAVGGAMGANRLPIVIPCHRVLAANGRLGGFSGGLGIKRHLLALEGIAWRE